ncbi:hypothetical protein JCM33374_g6283 [Metschnikowia sp. JCM 33374]|nr:hypothetical protein JCM33374_g6283 [Metschnikowia sp. JCM 33374]
MISVHFISLISRDDQPLYIQSFDSGPKRDEIDPKNPVQSPTSSSADPISCLSAEDANKFLKYNFLSHMALDVFASPMSLHLREQQGDPDGVLLLFIQDDVTVYGMETNNGLKMVVGISEEVNYRPRVKSLFSQIHRSYLRAVCNPFTDVSSSGDQEKILHTDSFDRRIKGIVSGWEGEGSV